MSGLSGRPPALVSFNEVLGFFAVAAVAVTALNGVNRYSDVHPVQNDKEASLIRAYQKSSSDDGRSLCEGAARPYASYEQIKIYGLRLWHSSRPELVCY